MEIYYVAFFTYTAQVISTVDLPAVSIKRIISRLVYIYTCTFCILFPFFLFFYRNSRAGLFLSLWQANTVSFVCTPFYSSSIFLLHIISSRLSSTTQKKMGEKMCAYQLGGFISILVLNNWLLVSSI
jgi:hypothetical protein